MVDTLRVAVAGLGTVGAETVRLLHNDQSLFTTRAGRPIQVTAVSARDHTRDRGFNLAGLSWCNDAMELASRDDVDIIVELIGGSDGIAKDLIHAALTKRKSVVTANKALLAHHGVALGRAAEEAGVTLAFEGAVAGGIPIIKTM